MRFEKKCPDLYFVIEKNIGIMKLQNKQSPDLDSKTEYRSGLHEKKH
jgi:hypothetical protein